MKRLLFALGVLALLLPGLAYADQTITGGKDAGTNLILKSTTNPTKGYIGVDSPMLPADQIQGTAIITPATLQPGLTDAYLAWASFTYNVAAVGYSKEADATGVAPGNDVIPLGKYGAAALDIGADGVIDAVEAADNATGYSSLEAALVGIPDPATGHARMGTVAVNPYGIETSPTLAIGSDTTKVANAEFTAYFNSTQITVAANATGTAPGNDVIPSGKYGAVAFDVDQLGTILATEATANSTGYTSAELALAGLPSVSTSRLRIGTVTAMKSDGAFTFGTTALNAANTTVAYTSTTPATAFTFGTTSLTSPLAVVTITTYPGLTSVTLFPGAQGWSATTQPAGSNSDQLATTAYVDSALGGKLPSPAHTALCVIGYDANDVLGCYTTWAKADVGNIITNGELTADGDVSVNTSTNMFEFRSGGTTYYPVRKGVDTRTEEIVFEIDGNGSAITSGVKAERYFAHAATITGWTMLADQAGTCELELWKDTYANFPPDVADKKTASLPPVLGANYSKSAVTAGTAPGNDVIPSGKYGAVAFDIGANGTIDAIEATDNATGYDSAELAVAGLPAAEAGHVRMGTVTATKSDGAFTFGTTALNAANTVVAYTSSATTAKGIISSPTLAIGSTTTAVSSAAFNYYVGEAIKGQSTTLTGWTTAIAVGDTLRVNADYCDTATRVTLILHVTALQ